MGIAGSPLEGVEKFARADGAVAVVTEMLAEDDGIFQRGGLFAPTRAVGPEEVAIEAGGGGMHAGQDGDARGVAGGRGAVGVGEGDGAPRETVEIRSLTPGWRLRGRCSR